MIATEGRARRIALACYEAWARRDMAGALEHVDDDVVCDGPDGRVEGVLAFADLLGASLRELERTDLRAAFGDDRSAVLLHDDRTMRSPRARSATHVMLRDGRISYVRLVRDRAEGDGSPCLQSSGQCP